MATRKNKSALGDYTGTIDTVVVSRWNNIDVMKSKPGKRRKKTTSKKLKLQNKVFKMVNNFFYSAMDYINIGYQKPKIVKMTPFNSAVSYHMENAVVADADGPAISLPEIKLSMPIRKTQNVWNPVLTIAENKVTVTWELNPFPQKCSQLDDTVILVYFDIAYKLFEIVAGVIKRSDLTFTKTFVNRYTGHELHWYMFLISSDKKLVSETEYLGKVTVTKTDPATA